jgi:hypothetical protein
MVLHLALESVEPWYAAGRPQAAGRREMSLRAVSLGSAAVICASSFAGAASAAPLIVPATADLFSSGQAVAAVSRGGTLPIEVTLPAGVDRSITFHSVTGAVVAGPSFWPSVGPDGGTTMAFGPRPTDVSSASGIAGMRHPRFEFLAGVFLDGSTPAAGTEPARLDFNVLGAGFPELSSLLRQTFAIGDGLTGTGSGNVQVFHIPDSATRLYLGFVDGYDFQGVPSQYQDNTGSFSVNFTVVPEPGVALLAVAGGITVFAIRHRSL